MTTGAENCDRGHRKEEVVLSALFLLERTVRSHGSAHPLARQIAGRLAQALHDARPPMSLQFVGTAVFRDLSLVPVSLLVYRQLEELSRNLRNLGVDELSFDQIPALTDLIRFGEALAKGSARKSDALTTLDIPGLHWRTIEGARWGLKTEAVDEDIYAATQVALAVADTETLTADRDSPWNWSTGLTVIRRLDRAFRNSQDATSRALEVRPEGWTMARRAVSSAFRLLIMLDAVGASREVRRAATHGGLALAVQGLRPRGGLPMVPAAEELVPRLVDCGGVTRAGIEPHRLRMTALIHRLLPKYSGHRDAPGIIHLLLLAYDLERRRCPAGTDLDLTSGDLLAIAVQDAGGRYDSSFVRLAVDTAGRFPVGAQVELEDGRTGIILETNPSAPRLPRILVDSQIVVPESPVRLISPLHHRGA